MCVVSNIVFCCGMCAVCCLCCVVVLCVSCRVSCRALRIVLVCCDCVVLWLCCFSFRVLDIVCYVLIVLCVYVRVSYCAVMCCVGVLCQLWDIAVFLSFVFSGCYLMCCLCCVMCCVCLFRI